MRVVILVLALFVSNIANAAVPAESRSEIVTTLESDTDATPSWKMMGITSYFGGRAGIEASRKIKEGLWGGVSYSVLASETHLERQRAHAMSTATIRYFPGRFAAIESEGFYVGGALTYVETIRVQNHVGERVNAKSNRFGNIVFAGWEHFPRWFGQDMVVRTGMGYGEASDYDGDERSTGGRINLSPLLLIHADFGVGIRF